MNLVGTTLGQFQVVEELGRGGMATVYKGVQLSLNRPVAIKVLHQEFGIARLFGAQPTQAVFMFGPT